MKKRSFFFIAFFLFSFALTYQYKPLIIQKIHASTNATKSFFLKKKENLLLAIEVHFNQKEQIEFLKKQVKELEPKASLSVALASKLNHLLKESNLQTSHPQLHLVQNLGYVSMQDKNRLWLDFPAFEPDKNYGLIYQGYTAGIVREHMQEPLAVLQSSNEALYSVFIGKDTIPGVAFGAGKNIQIQYIPNYDSPKVGDEVVTSGHDKIFYEGIKVGRVIAVKKKDMYTIATVKPYANLKHAQFFYAVEVK